MHYLWYDTETGGLDYKKSPVLTMYMAICDQDHNVIADLDLKLKPESMEGLIIEQGAINANGIDIDAHLADPNTLTYAQARPIIIKFLEDNKIPKKRKSFRPSGHNIPFDDDFIKHYLLGDDWDRLVHHGKLDTFTLTVGLIDMGILPNNLGSLTSLVEHFGIPMGEAHTAKGDVHMNIKMYKAMRQMVSSLKTNVSSIDKNLLSIIEA